MILSELTSFTFYRRALGASHQYGLPFSKWFHDANSEYEVILLCVKSVYLPFGMEMGWEFGAEAADVPFENFWSERIRMPGEWFA